MEDGRCTDSMALVTAKKYGISADIIRRAQQLSAQFEDLCRNDSTPTAGMVASPFSTHAASTTSARPGSPSSAAIAPLSPNRDSDSEEALQQKHHTAAGRRYNLNTDVAPLLRSLSGEAGGAVQIIAAAWEPPVGLEGSSCVYVLQLYSLTKVRC